MALRSRDRLLRPLVFAVALKREEPRHAAPAGAGDDAFVADENDAVAAFAHALLAVVGVDAKWSGRAQAAVGPADGDRRHVAARAEAIGVERAGGDDFGVDRG